MTSGPLKYRAQNEREKARESERESVSIVTELSPDD